MTLKEAILKSLEDINDLTNYTSIYNHIVDKNYYDFGVAKTPNSTISALLDDFIRNGDERVKRIKQEGEAYLYYLAKNEPNIEIEKLNSKSRIGLKKNIPSNKLKTYEERDLHKLLSSYLKNTDTYSKTIFHKQSNWKDSNQIWTHPDMIGIKFLNLKAFDDFVNQTVNLINASEQIFSLFERKFTEFCDDYFKNDSEIEKYCKEKHIPLKYD